MTDKSLEVINAEVVAITPMALIQQAQEGNASIEHMQQLFELQLRWEGNEARKAYNRAIAEFKSKNIKIIKKSLVDFTSQKGRTHYKHANLADAIDQIIEGLSDCGLSNSWKTVQEGKQITVCCRISHVEGHHEEVSLTAEADSSGNKNSIQAIGSTVTYLERYTLKSALGLAEHDDDGKASEQPEKPVEYISADQFEKIDLLITQVEGLDVDQFCKRYRIDGLDLLHASIFDGAVKFLNKRIGGDK